MASRIASRAMGAARARPMLPIRSLAPAFTTSFATSQPRAADAGMPQKTPQETNSSVTSEPNASAAGVPQKSPQDTAQSVLNTLPGSSIAAKVAYLSAGTGLAIAAISNEILVINEETIVAVCLLSVYYGIATYGGPAYNDWAQGQRNKQLRILNAAREGHKDAVKARMENVKDLSGVIDVTKNLFEVSKETAKFEAQAYELEQKTALAHEAKATLESWVRYEAQVKQRQQKELADTIMSKIEKELENPRVLDQILKQSVQDIERIVSQKA